MQALVTQLMYVPHIQLNNQIKMIFVYVSYVIVNKEYVPLMGQEIKNIIFFKYLHRYVTQYLRVKPKIWNACRQHPYRSNLFLRILACKSYYFLTS